MITLANPKARSADKARMLGFRMYFPSKKDLKTFDLGYTRSPQFSPTKTEVEMKAAPNGAEETVRIFQTGFKDVVTFESISVDDPGVRYLHAGNIQGWLDESDVAAFQATFDYEVGDLVRPAVANGYLYKVTVAGESAAAAPGAWPTAAGSTVVSGGVTFALAGTLPTSVWVTPTQSTPVDGMAIMVFPAADGGKGELRVYPNAQLTGDGVGAGLDGANGSALKFNLTALESKGFPLPASITSKPGFTVGATADGGFTIGGIANEDLDTVAAELATDYFASL